MKTNSLFTPAPRLSLCLLLFLIGLLSQTANQVFSQNVAIPDTVFLYALIEEGVDTNGDSLISHQEAEDVLTLNLRGFMNTRGHITDMTGIEAFLNLETLDCYQNRITSLDLSSNPGLKHLTCSQNSLSSLDLSENTALAVLHCGGNQLGSLDLTYNVELKELFCYPNLLTELDVTKNTLLTFLYCGNENQSNGGGNLLTNLDLSNNPALKELFCDQNQLSSLDLSNNLALTHLSCSYNQLSSLDLSVNRALTYLEIVDIPGLNQVCVWETFHEDITRNTQGSPNIHFTTECATGIEARPTEGLSIYPNPTHRFLTIDTQNIEDSYLEIRDLSGKLIYQEAMAGNFKQIDLSTFTRGIYFLTVSTKDGFATERVVKF